MKEELLIRVQRTIATHQLFAPKTSVVIAVSGGPDSVALLHLLYELQSTWKFRLHIAHLDHALREESREDAQFVHALSVQWGIPVTIERREVGVICAQAGWSLEDGARRLRYQFLLEVAKRQQASVIALAHTADDQAETVLMRLMRGTGLMGLGAIPMKRQLEESVWLARPLLEVWRGDVLRYLNQHRLSYREDATNHDRRFVRNRVRHELLPLLERDYNPRIKMVLAQLAEQSTWDYSYLQAAAKRQWKRTAKVTPQQTEDRQEHRLASSERRNGHRFRASPLQRVSAPRHGMAPGNASGSTVVISVPLLLRQPKALQRQLIRRAIQQIRGDLGQFEFRHWREVERLCLERPEGTLLDLPGGVQLLREQERIVCRHSPYTLPQLLLD